MVLRTYPESFRVIAQKSKTVEDIFSGQAIENRAHNTIIL